VAVSPGRDAGEQLDRCLGAAVRSDGVGTTRLTATSSVCTTSSITRVRAGMTDTGRQRYVIHLAVVAAGLPGAKQLARTLAGSLALLPDFDPGETTVPEEDNHHQVFCDRQLDGHRRCARRADHHGPSAPKRR
jgi:hypothetical protein